MFPPQYSIIMEMDNVSTISCQEFSEVLESLRPEIEGVEQALDTRKPELFFVFAGDQENVDELRGQVKEIAPALFELCDLRIAVVPNGRYYQLKNAGGLAATGQLILFLDSDTFPEPGWLQTMLAPFEDATTLAVNGYTYLGVDNIVSRTFALIWFFPLRNGDERSAQRRALNANNCAFRRDWFQENPFPENNGFKVDCTLLLRTMTNSGVHLHRAPAYARHIPLRGWRFLGWRALVTGRDADRKYELLKSSGRIRRTTHAVSRSMTHTSRVLRRIMSGYSRVDLKLWQTPFALSLGWMFYGLAFIGQFWRAIGLAPDKPETIPEGINHS